MNKDQVEEEKYTIVSLIRILGDMTLTPQQYQKIWKISREINPEEICDDEIWRQYTQ